MMTSALFTDFQIFGNSALVCTTAQSFLSRAGNCGRDGLLLAKTAPPELRTSRRAVSGGLEACTFDCKDIFWRRREQFPSLVGIVFHFGKLDEIISSLTQSGPGWIHHAGSVVEFDQIRPRRLQECSRLCATISQD